MTEPSPEMNLREAWSRCESLLFVSISIRRYDRLVLSTREHLGQLLEDTGPMPHRCEAKIDELIKEAHHGTGDAMAPHSDAGERYRYNH